MVSTPAPVRPPAPADDEIDLRQLATALARRWRLIAAVSGGTLALSAIVTLLQKPVWEGEFQIVLASNDDGGGRLAQLASANPLFANLAGLGDGKSKGGMETEVKILESPSVLKPVFDFVLSRKRQAGQEVQNLRFSDWIKNVEVKLEKGTAVLNISYRDSDKQLILPVIRRISSDYQEYSGRDRRRDIANSIAYLRQAIATLEPKAERSSQLAQDFALTHGLSLGDGGAVSRGEAGQDPAMSSVDASRQQAQARVLLLKQQLQQAQRSGDSVLFQAPQIEANSELYSRYQAVEEALNNKRSRLRDNDPLVQDLRRQRQSLIATLNQQTVGLLGGQLATAQAGLEAASRPKEVVLRHRELMRQAARDDRTLTELENQLQLAQLEQARQTEPWELISTPTLLDQPVSPSKSRNLALGLLVGLVLGSGAALVADRRSGLVFASDELQQLLPYPLLATLDATDPGSWTTTLELLAQGALAGQVQVALVPAGIVEAAEGVAQQLQAALQRRNPAAQVILTNDLASAASCCNAQLLLASPGAASRQQLAQLCQNLQLQGQAVTGLLLLADAS